MNDLAIYKRFAAIARKLAACRGGVAMFELAITLPLLLVIFAGGWEFARALWQYDILNKGVRDAARYLARVDDPVSDASKEMARRLVITGDIDTSQAPRIDYTKLAVNVGTRTFANTDGVYRSSDGLTGAIAVVQVRAVYDIDAPLLAFLGIANPLRVTVAHEQRHIGD
jgi:Flp pilus assembly protein TadG